MKQTVMSRRDMRLQFINQSNLRNDIQVFDFVPGGRGFGTGGARIISAKMTDLEVASCPGLSAANRCELQLRQRC